MKKAIVRFTVLSFFLTALPMAAQTGVWTAVGSTGSIDEASLGLYAVNINNLLHQAGAVGTVVARFNVTNTFGGGLTDTPPWNTFEMTYLDTAAASTVSATLFQVNRCSNATTAICSVTSVDSTAPTCVRCTFQGLNFGANNYVVEVRVTRNVANVTPQLFGLRIF